MAEDNFAMGYALGQDSNNSCNDGFGFGNGGWIWIILLLAVFGGGWGFGGGGWGGGFGGYGGAGLQGMATRADINEGFALNGITTGITAIQQGICDSTYALNNAITGGFHGVERGLYDVSRQLADCCCENRAAIAQVRYDMATQACDTRNTIQTATRDMIDNANANTRQIMDFLVQDKISALTAENQSLKFAASQANQNAVLMAAMDANKAELLRRTGHDCPTAAYIVQPPTPVSFPVNACGQAQWSGNGCGQCGF